MHARLDDPRETFRCDGGEMITYRSLAELTCEVFDLDPALLRSGPPEPGGMERGTVPFDTTLSTDITGRRLGSRPSTNLEILEGFRDERAAA